MEVFCNRFTIISNVPNSQLLGTKAEKFFQPIFF